MPKLCPLNTFVDASGNPLVGGKVYTYITGTSTPKKTYRTNAGDTPYPNPIILQNNGRAEIWLDTDVAYRLVIKDRDGTQIGSTIDDVTPITSISVLAGGADLDISGYSILATGTSDIPLTPDTGAVILDGVYWPTTAGQAGQVLALDDATHAAWSSGGVTDLDAVPDITITSAANGDLLKYNGSAWVNSPQSTLSVTASQVSDIATSSTDFSAKTGAISQWTNDSSYTTNATVASAAMAFTNKSGAISQWTNDSNFGTSTALLASQGTVETGTSSTSSPSCLTMQNHAGMAKAWINFTAVFQNSSTIQASYNITSITGLTGPNRYRFTFTTPFSSTNYVVVCPQSDEAFAVSRTDVITRATTYCDIAGLGNGKWSVMFYGDQ